MPVMHFYGPELPREKKEALVKEFSAAASRSTGIPVKKMIVYLHATAPDEVGVGGDLLANRQ